MRYHLACLLYIDVCATSPLPGPGLNRFTGSSRFLASDRAKARCNVFCDSRAGKTLALHWQWAISRPCLFSKSHSHWRPGPKVRWMGCLYRYFDPCYIVQGPWSFGYSPPHAALHTWPSEREVPDPWVRCVPQGFFIFLVTGRRACAPV